MKELSICANCIHVRSVSSRPVLRCAARPTTSKPARVHPVSGELLPEVVTLANCHWRNERGDCKDFTRRAGAEPVTGHAAQLRDERPLPPRPRQREPDPEPRGFFAWLMRND